MVDRQLKKQEFQVALRSKDPYALAKVIQVKLPTSLTKFTTTTSSSNNSNPVTVTVYDESTNTDWSGIVNLWFDVLDALEVGNANKCYDSQAALHSQFNQLFASSSGNFLVPTLHAVCKSTHKIAVLGDRVGAGSSGQGDHTKLHNAVTLLQESYSRTYNDRKELKSVPKGQPPLYDTNDTSSKKAGVLGIVNELFCIYFQLNTLRLCKNLVKPVEVRKLHLENSGGSTIGQLITYKYYTGRLHLFEDNYIDAENNLQYAFEKSHNNAYHNKRCILRYLIPVKLYRGKLPSTELLQKYQLHEFISLVDSIRKGDLKTFNNSLIDYQHRFIRQGTYLLLEKCKTVCYRNLFKRIHVVLNEKHQISLQQVTTVFTWLNMPIDLDEVECILANLIYRGYVRGYLSHSKRVLVLSKRDPFPLSSVVAK